MTSSPWPSRGCPTLWSKVEADAGDRGLLLIHRGLPEDPVKVAAWFVLSRPGWGERVLDRHVRTDSGSCAECGSTRPVGWPCVLVHIAHRAELLRTPSAGGRRPPPLDAA